MVVTPNNGPNAASGDRPVPALPWSFPGRRAVARLSIYSHVLFKLTQTSMVVKWDWGLLACLGKRETEGQLGLDDNFIEL